MIYCIQFLDDFLYFLSVFYACASFQNSRRFYGWERFLEYLIYAGAMFMVSFFCKNYGVRLVITMGLLGIGFHRRFPEKGPDFLRYGCMVVFLNGLLITNADMMLEILTGQLIFIADTLRMAVLSLGATLIAFAFLAAFLHITEKSYRISLDTLTIRQQVFLTAVEFFDMLMLFWEEIRVAENHTEAAFSLAEVFSVVVPIGIFLQLWFLLRAFTMSNSWKEKTEVTGKLLQEREAYFTDMEAKEQDTRRFRHDLKNHMLVMQKLHQEQDNAGLEEYFQKISGQLGRLETKIWLNNGIAEVIAERYAREAEKYGIRMRVRGFFPEVCSLEVYDLCTILSNLLSNAVEAVHACGGEKIRLDVRFDEENLFLQIENDCPKELKVDSDRLPTSKADRQSHGFGLENVRDSVEKYHGWLWMRAENGIFCTLVELERGERKGR